MTVKLFDTEGKSMDIDFDKLKQEQAKLEETWQFLRIPFEYPAANIPLWQLDYGSAAILSAFKVFAKKAAKVTDPVAYLGTMLRNAKKQNMTPEQRAEEISQMRSAVGKIGAAKTHEKDLSYIKAEFAKVLSDED